MWQDPICYAVSKGETVANIKRGTYHPHQVTVGDLPASILLPGPRVLILSLVDQDLAIVYRVRNAGVGGEVVRSLEVCNGHSAGKTADVNHLRAEVMLSGDKVVQTGRQVVNDGLYTIQYTDGVRVVGTGVSSEHLSQHFVVATIDGERIERQGLTNRFRRNWIRESLRREKPRQIAEAHRPRCNLGAVVVAHTGVCD